MSFVSWRDVPTSVAFHHHCVATVETSNEPGHWTDAGQARPDLVVYSADEAITWMRQQLADNRERAVQDYGRREWIEAALSCDDMWHRVRVELDSGRWTCPTFHLSRGAKLVLFVLGFANHDQSPGDYARCRVAAHSPGV